MKRALFAALLLAGTAQTAGADPAVPATLPAAALEDFAHVDIGNGLIQARVYPTGKHEWYRGTRFDHAGVLFHIKYQGQDFSTYWFDHFAVDPHDPTRYGVTTQNACCSTSGPVEEFAPVGFDESPQGGRFLKIGVGILQKDFKEYDQFHTLPILNPGKWTFKASKTGAHWAQDLKDAETGYGYHHEKTVRLVPGKPQMTITDVLTNTGSKPIVTTVYNHNFLTLDPGNGHIAITAPFAMTAEKPLQPELAKIDGKTLRFLAPIPSGQMVMSLIDGFSDKVSDYDFTVANTKTGFAERIRADQPVAKINSWTIDTTLGWEPYIAIDLKPGETKRWTYTYDFIGPKDHQG